GRINLYDEDGRFLGSLKDDGRPIQIDGLWSLENDVPTADPDQLFFTAGPVQESHGIFGYLKKRH
ncbi:MAG: TIGR03118 family protein, partial [Chitinophagales bacterium]